MNTSKRYMPRGGMPNSAIKLEVLQEVIDEMEDEFHTLDLATHPQVAAAHADVAPTPGALHTAIGRVLARWYDDLGIERPPEDRAHANALWRKCPRGA